MGGRIMITRFSQELNIADVKMVQDIDVYSHLGIFADIAIYAKKTNDNWKEISVSDIER
jgi:hypothetical protein